MIITIKSNDLKASIDTYGAYVNEFTKNGENIFFPKAEIKVGEKTKIRGGSHPCLPHFGPCDKVNQQNHGFARESEWKVEKQEENKVVLKLNENIAGYENMVAYLTYELEADTFITDLVVENNGKEDFTITPAFHPYFAFNDAEKVFVDGGEIEFNKALDDSLFYGDVKELKNDKFTIEFKDNNMNKFVVWSDYLDNYICVEPSYNHKALDEDRELYTVKSGEKAEFNFTIEII